MSYDPVNTWEIEAIHWATTALLDHLQGSDVIIWTDSKTALSWVTRSAPLEFETGVGEFWKLCIKHGVAPWLEWVPSALNMEDGPSRGIPPRHAEYLNIDSEYMPVFLKPAPCHSGWKFDQYAASI